MRKHENINLNIQTNIFSCLSQFFSRSSSIRPTTHESTAKRTLKFYFIIIVITAETELSGATMIASPYTRPGNDIQLFFCCSIDDSIIFKL